jgi:hypothetical protein
MPVYSFLLFFLVFLILQHENDCSWTPLAPTDNSGSTPSGNMNFVATACIKMRMTPEEAINAAINGAYAMGI